MAKRDTFSELMEGIKAMKLHREGKLALRIYARNKTFLTRHPRAKAVHTSKLK